jgi:nucleoside-diphosphate-sugar epimerase
MKVLITGHKGFVGKYFWKTLDNGKNILTGIDIKDGIDCRDFFKKSDVIKSSN